MRGVLDLRGDESSVRGFRGYADADGACSNRNALPVCVTRHSRQFAANRGCRSITPESTATSQSRGTIMRLRNSAHPAISSAPTLTTATLEACFARRAAPALVISSGSDAHSFAWAARGCASGPARRMLGRADEHGCSTRDAGRWPWRASAGVIKRSRAGLSTVRELLPPRDRPHYGLLSRPEGVWFRELFLLLLFLHS